MAAAPRRPTGKRDVVLERRAGGLGVKTVPSLSPHSSLSCARGGGDGAGDRGWAADPGHRTALSSCRQVLAGHAERSGQGGAVGCKVTSGMCA